MTSSPNTDLGVSSGESYQDEFDPQAYLHFFDDLTKFHAQPLKLLHEFYNSYGSTSSSLKVLDYGSGPTVLYAISSALQASEIILADYTDKNREAIQHWLKKAPEAHDWTPFFKYVVQSLEGLGEEEVVKRQEDVRTLIKAVVKCDIHMDPPIQSGYEGPYDVIFSSLALECASSLASSALQASEIVLADYTEKNREAIQHWLKKTPEAYDWTPFFKYVVQSLEGLGEEEVAKRQEDVRTLIKAVVKCDIHMDPPIQSGYECPYDVILSSLCLECACSSLEEYEVAMTKLSTLLKPGGRIVLRSIEAGEDNAPTHFCMVGAQKFVALNITESFMRSTLEKAGFYNISFKRQLREDPGVNIPQEASDYYAMSFITATKK